MHGLTGSWRAVALLHRRFGRQELVKFEMSFAGVFRYASGTRGGGTGCLCRDWQGLVGTRRYLGAASSTLTAAVPEAKYKLLLIATTPSVAGERRLKRQSRRKAMAQIACLRGTVWSNNMNAGPAMGTNISQTWLVHLKGSISPTYLPSLIPPYSLPRSFSPISISRRA